jgi:hypothetical protein
MMYAKKTNWIILLSLMVIFNQGKARAVLSPDSSLYSSSIIVLSKVNGWAMQVDKYRYFTTHTLFDVINGGADEYIKTGMVDGITCSFDGKDKTNAELYLENFAKPDNVKKMIARKKESASDAKKVPGFKANEAFCDEVIGGCVVYFCIGSMYCELTMTGFSDAQAALDASQTIIAVLKK